MNTITYKALDGEKFEALVISKMITRTKSNYKLENVREFANVPTNVYRLISKDREYNITYPFIARIEETTDDNLLIEIEKKYYVIINASQEDYEKYEKIILNLVEQNIAKIERIK